MKRILINATHNEEIRVALCKDNHMYDFDLENRTREQKKSNIYKAHVTRVEPSLEAVFVEYGAERQGFLPIREIAKEYLTGNPRNENIRNLIQEGDSLVVQVEKEERGNKGAALSTYVSLAGRYLVLMPNNPRGGGISRQISGKQREEMKRIVNNLQMPKGMSVIIRTAGIGKSQEDLQHDLNHLLNIWSSIGEQDKEYPSPRLLHQEAGVVTRALRDYMRDDIAEIWIDSANAYEEAVYFIKSVMPKQLDKVRKYTDLEPMFARFGIEKQIETTYQREVRLPSGGSIVIDQTEAMVAIDINSAKSTKGSDVAETAYHTNLEAAEEIARQLRLRDMGGLVVIDFIDMYDKNHQKEVTKRLMDSTKFDRARVQFGEISKFGLMEMSRQRLRPSLEESTAYKCPRCHGTGMIRDIRSLSLSIVRQIEQLALTHRQGEIQAEVPTDIAAFILNEKRDTLVYLEQDSGTRITILPHAHLNSPEYELHYKPDGFAPASYERISNSEDKHTNDRGYEVDWQIADNERPEHQPKRQPKKPHKNHGKNSQSQNHQSQKGSVTRNQSQVNRQATQGNQVNQTAEQPQAVAWLSNLFAPTPQAKTADTVSSQDVAQAIESIVNSGAQSLGSFGQVDMSAMSISAQSSGNDDVDALEQEREERKNKRRPSKNEKSRDKKDRRYNNRNGKKNQKYKDDNRQERLDDKNDTVNYADKPKREPNSRRDSRGEFPRKETLEFNGEASISQQAQESQSHDTRHDKPNQKPKTKTKQRTQSRDKNQDKQKSSNINEVNLQVSRNQDSTESHKTETVHLSLDNSKAAKSVEQKTKQAKPTKETQSKQDKQHEAVKSEAQPKPSQQGESQQSKEQKGEQNLAPAPQPLASDTVTTDESEVNLSKQPNVDTASVAPAPRLDGRVNNDPRVVQESLAEKITEQLTAELTKEQDNTSVTTTLTEAPVSITGSVGEFLRATLKDAEEQISQQGVIATFIKAIAQVNQVVVSSDDVTENKQHVPSVNNQVALEVESKVAQALAEFDFSNYGYQPLSKEYLGNFNLQTKPVSQYGKVAGKTEADTSPIGRRASNDPRGQHPDFVTANIADDLDVKEPKVEAVITEDVITETYKTETSNTEVTVEDAVDVNLVVNQVEQPVEVTVETETATDSQSSEAKPDDNQTQDNTQTQDREQAEKPDDFANAFGRLLDESSEESESVKAEAEQVVDNDTDETTAANLEDEQNTDEKQERGKTTFDKYKSMLANVSEQMLNQGTSTSLFLSSQPVPKSRIRKTKKDDS